MSNIQKYKDIIAFHPGYYINEIIEDMGITQAEFAVRMDTTPKTISKLVNGECNLSNDLIQKLSSMLGLSVEFWLNLQNKYEEKVLAIEQMRKVDAQKEIMKSIDYSYFVKVGNLPAVRKTEDKIKCLCKYLKIADLRVLQKSDFLVNFRSGLETMHVKNEINSRAWLQAAMNLAETKKTQKFDAQKLKEYLPEIRSMTVLEPQIFLPRLIEIFEKCGVIFILLPTLKNSGINGAVKWYGHDKVLLAMNNRRCYADTFWFSLFHEIKHVLQQKVKMTFLNGNDIDINGIDNYLEKEANEFAGKYLIPPEKYEMFKHSHMTEESIKEFSSEIGIHPGIVVGRLQHDNIISVKYFNKLKKKYKIFIQ